MQTRLLYLNDTTLSFMSMVRQSWRRNVWPTMITYGERLSASNQSKSIGCAKKNLSSSLLCSSRVDDAFFPFLSQCSVKEMDAELMDFDLFNFSLSSRASQKYRISKIPCVKQRNKILLFRKEFKRKCRCTQDYLLVQSPTHKQWAFQLLGFHRYPLVGSWLSL